MLPLTIASILLKSSASLPSLWSDLPSRSTVPAAAPHLLIRGLLVGSGVKEIIQGDHNGRVRQQLRHWNPQFGSNEVDGHEQRGLHRLPVGDEGLAANFEDAPTSHRAYCDRRDTLHDDRLRDRLEFGGGQAFLFFV